MNLEYLAIAIVALVAVACASPAHSPPPAENRYRKTGNRADRATDLKRENTAASTTASKNVPLANGETLDRTKKAIAPWDAEHTEYQSHIFTSMSVWRPPVYALSRPYFIPIYGSSGRIPIYFAPQPLGGQDKPPFIGPGYLPPKEQPETQSPSVNVKDRFYYDDDDDRPVWNKGSDNSISESDKPARPPADNSVHLSAADENTMREIFKIRPTQPTPQPPRARTTTTTTTSAPSTTQGPSNCVWAVVSCCSAETNVYPERCFEQRGCPGPFWSGSPCDTEFAKAAVAAALKYYNP